MRGTVQEGPRPPLVRPCSCLLKATRAIDKFNPALIREQLAFRADSAPWCIRPYKAAPCTGRRLIFIFGGAQRHEFTNMAEEGFAAGGKLVGGLLPIDQSVFGKKTLRPLQHKVSLAPGIADQLRIFGVTQNHIHHRGKSRGIIHRQRKLAIMPGYAIHPQAVDE